VISVDDGKLSLEVEPSAPTLGAIPSWEGEIIPVEHDIALEVGQLRKTFSQATDSDPSRLSQDLYTDKTAVSNVRQTVETHIRDYPLPTDNEIIVERFENCIIIHACFGNLVNETVALVLATLLQAKYGINVLTQVDAYRIALITPLKLNPKNVVDELLKLKPDDTESIVMNCIESTELFAWRHWHIAKRFGAVEAKADYRLRRAKLLVEIFRETPLNQEARREILLEKLDLENTVRVIRKIVSGEIGVKSVEQKGMSCSPLALPIIDKILPHNLLRPALPTQPLAEIVKERLMSTNVRLVCIFNADWESVRAVKTLSEVISCPRCRSTLVAVAYHGDQELFSIVKKKKNHVKLSAEEEIRWNRAWRSASLVQTAGRKAILAMAARGVGPMTASRILRRYVRSEAEFYSEILKAEREYQRTRLFWD